MNMTSRRIICSCVISIFYFINQCEGKKPHIIAIIADDLGWNDVSFHGANQIPTPNIDALAYNGVILNRHYTQPTCTPSRAAFLTGLYPIRTGMYRIPLRPSEPKGMPLNFTLLPEHMKKLGYVTRLIGKWHVGYYTPQHTPTHRGFDSFFGYYNGYIKYFKHTINYANHAGHDVHRDYLSNLNAVYTKGYFTDIITQEVENLISKHNQEIPLYLQIAHLAPHTSDNEDPLEVRDVNEINLNFGHIKDINRRKFAGMVYALDESVGRTVRALKNANMLKDSIILFISDNGAQSEGVTQNDGSNYPLRGLKFTVYEGGVRGVACIYSPLIKNAERVSNQLIHITDWLPTFYSAAGGNIATLGELDGVDQWSAIKYGKRSRRHSVLINMDQDFRNEAAILGKFKLIKGPLQLYSKYFGDPGNNISYPAYNLTSILFSLSNQAINTIATSTLTLQKISKLRSASKVRCQNSSQLTTSFGTSLYDISKDPCESIDISSLYPEVARNLNYIINDYRHVMMYQNPFFFSDPASYPENFDGSWMPWIKNT